MTSEDLTLTVLAPASFTSPPSVVSLSNSPLSPVSDSIELASDRRADVFYGHKMEDSSQSVSGNEQTVPMSDVVQNTDMGCSHLWLQSRVPLGYVIFNFCLFFFQLRPLKFFFLLEPDVSLPNLQQLLSLKFFHWLMELSLLILFKSRLGQKVKSRTIAPEFTHLIFLKIGKYKYREVCDWYIFLSILIQNFAAERKS